MYGWLKRKFGITPELEEKVRQIEQRAYACAAKAPFGVHRSVLVLLPLERCFEWTNQWSAHSKGARPLTLGQDQWTHARAYLVDRVEDDRALAALVNEHRRYFLDSYINGFAPTTLWPWTPSADEFPQWFEARLVGFGTWDLEQAPIEKEPDLAAAAMREF